MAVCIISVDYWNRLRTFHPIILGFLNLGDLIPQICLATSRGTFDCYQLEDATGGIQLVEPMNAAVIFCTEQVL